MYPIRFIFLLCTWNAAQMITSVNHSLYAPYYWVTELWITLVKPCVVASNCYLSARSNWVLLPTMALQRAITSRLVSAIRSVSCRQARQVACAACKLVKYVTAWLELCSAIADGPQDELASRNIASAKHAIWSSLQ